MSVSVDPQAIDDLFNMVNEDYFTFGKSFADLAALWPDAFCALNVLNRAQKKGGSHKVTWRLKIANVGNYRSDVELYDEDAPARNKQFVEGYDTYTGFNIGTHFDVNEDEFASPDVAVKVDFLKELISSAIQRLKLSFSADCWSWPATASDKGLHGIPYWVAKSTATTVTDFSLGGPSVYGDNTVGGVDISTYTQYKNGTGVFATLASEDGLDLLSEAMNKCNFRTQSEMIGSPEQRQKLPTWSMYTTYDNFEALERYTRNQNDNVGKDLGAYRGSVVFRQQPIMYLWELDEQEIEDGIANPAYGKHTDNPIYGVNWTTFKFLHKLGSGFEKNGPRPAPNQRHVRRVDWDQFAQLVCDDRRKNFCLHQAS